MSSSANAIAILATLGALGACGGKQPSTTPNNADPNATSDTRTELEKRLEAACTVLGPRLTQCAVDDAKARFAEGAITKKEFDAATASDIQAALTRDWQKKCDRPDRSSRQVRVLEVCHAEEQQCAPLLDCLEHLAKQP